MSKITAFLALSSLVLVSFGARAEEPAKKMGHEKSHGVSAKLELSPELAVLLRKEMKAIDGGMKELLSALSGGEFENAAKIARDLEATYILRQSLTKPQMKELHTRVPKGFLTMDHAFHARAGRLAKAADAQDGEVAAFYYSELVQACVGCHSHYATERFPGFAKKKTP